MFKDIIIKGARQHNLKGINVTIPRHKLVVITGLSGSGKSSLAFDTLYAEGQRRYVESLSSYARQFLDQMQKPDVEHIEGLSPAIAIEQRTAGSNPRSTVATTTEIYDYLRLLYAHIGKPHCPKCGVAIKGQSAEAICEKIITLPPNRKMMLLAPYVIGRKGEQKDILDKLKRDGFVRARIDGEIYELDGKLPKLEKNIRHSIEAVVDRLVTGKTESSRLNDSIELALRCGEGVITVLLENPEDKKGKWTEEQISEQLACVKCGISFGQLAPRNFSFNSPYGACPTCNGLGTQLIFDPEMVIPDPGRTIKQGAIPPWRRGPRRLMIYYKHLLRCIAEHFGIEDMVTMPFKDIPKNVRDVLLNGSGDDIIKFDYWRSGKMHKLAKPFEGILKNLQRRYLETESEDVRERLKKYMARRCCPECKGNRLRPESLAVKVGDIGIHKYNELTVADADSFFEKLKLNDEEKTIAHEVIREIRSRLSFLKDVGLSYLNLNRESGTLSGGEAQRIRLATQIGSGLTGVLYILDEPSIGLHQKDNVKLLNTLEKLRDTGNTVIVVEHDLDTIRRADYVLDLGPGAGRHGGELVAAGTPKEVEKTKASITGKYLSGERTVPLPSKRIKGDGKCLSIEGAEHNNLKKINVKIPLGTFCCITGVSGSGKSSLIDDTLRVALDRHFKIGTGIPGKHKKISGLDNIHKVIVIDQSPIGRTPRSNPATYTDAFGIIRDLYAKLPESKMRGYKSGRFSFNVKGGRCEECHGDGMKKIEMQFLPEVYVTCSACRGRRFNRETLSVLFKGRSIADVLEMTVTDAADFFSAIPKLHRKLKTLDEVGLGYIHLGQPATTLSGGEAQRVKLSAELARIPRGHTLYILDEPTTGLHIADVEKLLEVLMRLRDQGNTVLVVEHNLELIKTADYIIDLGPEGGDKGGQLVAEGTPEQVAKNPKSFTGQFLSEILKK
ncbi:MAG TPA: excinuclease ABC subunit UvrA [Lentisphaeria bacterium]|nr:MAG: excinuclease ABC subunit A [Lentisphaerae bacterium GWF2_50_93]HCE46616.1 excinuclease ABC subunit UvrA [Lentisphaeria bacterium]